MRRIPIGCPPGGHIPGGRIHVTGATGAIGAALLPVLAPLGQVVAHGRADAPLPAADWLPARDRQAVVVHLAGPSHARDGAADPQALAAPHLAMVEGLLARGWCGHLLFLSSAAVYGPAARPIPESAPPAPMNAYGQGKLAVEAGLRRLAARHGFRLCLVRAANIYGSPQDLRRRRVTGLLAEAALGGSAFTLYGDGSSRRDYLHVTDLCRALALAIGCRAEGVLNLGSGTGIALAELIVLVERACAAPVRLHRLPAQAGESPCTVLDIARARQLLGWQPQVPLEQGIAELVAMMRTRRCTRPAAPGGNPEGSGKRR